MSVQKHNYIYIRHKKKGVLFIKKKRERLLEQAKPYYKTNKEKLQEKARDRYRELLYAEKYIKREYGRNRYKNMPEEDKTRLKQWQKSYRKAKKNIKNLFSLHFIKWKKKSWFLKKMVLSKMHFVKVNNQLILIK